MLKCIRIRTCTKKKLKYNLKLFKFRKSSQVLFSCQEDAIIRGSGSPARKGWRVRDRSSHSPSPQGLGPTNPLQGSREARKSLESMWWQTAPVGS